MTNLIVTTDHGQALLILSLISCLLGKRIVYGGNLIMDRPNEYPD